MQIPTGQLQACGILTYELINNHKLKKLKAEQTCIFTPKGKIFSSILKREYFDKTTIHDQFFN